MGSKDGHPATSAVAADAVYLHGVLEVTVFEADHLHNAIHGQIIKVSDRYMYAKMAGPRFTGSSVVLATLPPSSSVVRPGCHSPFRHEQ